MKNNPNPHFLIVYYDVNHLIFLNCSSNILEEMRKKLFTACWQLADIDKQRQFLDSRVISTLKKEAEV